MEEIDPKSVEKAREVLRARLFSINPDLASGKRANDFISNESTPQNRKEVYRY